MAAIRMNITVPEDVVKILKKKAKPGEKSAFIAEAIRSFVHQKSRQQLIAEMIEGYSSRRSPEEIEEQRDWDLTIADGLDDEY